MNSWDKSCRVGTLVILGAALVSGILLGCGGSHGGGGSTHEFAYVPTGTDIEQYSIAGDGQLTPLSPSTAPSTSPVAMVVSHDNRFAYAANTSPPSVTQYSINADGTLAPLTVPSVGCGTQPNAIAETQNGKFVYVLNHADNTISEYSVGVDGSLTALLTPTIAVASDGNGLVTTPNSGFLYATSYSSNTLSAFSIGVDGQLAPLGTPTYTVLNPTSPVVSPSGTHLYCALSIDGAAQFTIAGDGSLIPLSPATVAGPDPGNDAFAISPNGLFAYLGSFNGGVANSPVAQFSVNPDGTLTPLVPPTVTAGDAPSNMVVSAGSHFAYVVNLNDHSISEFSVGGTGKLTHLTPPTIMSTHPFQIVLSKK